LKKRETANNNGVIVKKVKDYFNILAGNGMVDTKIDDQFLNIFKL